MSRSALVKHARSKLQHTQPSAVQQMAHVAPTPPAAPPAPARVDPFFRPEDLITQDNFWAQWNGTFAELDHQLADLQANSTFQRAQLGQQHTRNASSINDDAAARGVGHSSIRDGNQAQEQADFTSRDQSLKDGVDRFSTYVAGRKNDFQTNVAPGFNSAMDAQATENAREVNDALPPGPPPPQSWSAPTFSSAAPAGAQPAPHVQPVPQGHSNHVAAFKPVVHKGKHYRYYAAANGKPERWVPMGPA